jgi:uncharacterized protein (TIGR02594 family)
MNYLTLQRTLAGLGYSPGPLDGIPGRQTIAALKRFQTAAGLVADGIAGPQTNVALQSATGGHPAPSVRIPASYPMTPWVDFAVTQMGVSEIVGARNSPVIMGWVQRLGARVLGINVTDDETAWCGTFVAMCLATTLPGESLPTVAVRASSWDAFGKRSVPTFGALLRFARPGGGHVGFFVGQDETHYHVLGGNQGNRVSVMRLEKSRLVACRWPSTVPAPKVINIAPWPALAGTSHNEG